MERKASGALIGLSIFLTIFVVVASIIIGAFYGTIEIIDPSSYGSSRIQKITNWPLIVGLLFSILYSIFLTILAMHVSQTHDRIVDIHNKLKADQPD
ncbi:MAG: hypothetical protein ACTJHW_15755 [Paenalcaligenes sp.]